jgi:hypothetical protein
MGQRNNDEREKLRNNRLTASNFGRIINMKLTTDSSNTIKDILRKKIFYAASENQNLKNYLNHCNWVLTTKKKQNKNLKK